jgi:hypothetical protein
MGSYLKHPGNSEVAFCHQPDLACKDVAFALRSCSKTLGAEGNPMQDPWDSGAFPGQGRKQGAPEWE